MTLWYKVLPASPSALLFWVLWTIGHFLPSFLSLRHSRETKYQVLTASLALCCSGQSNSFYHPFLVSLRHPRDTMYKVLPASPSALLFWVLWTIGHFLPSFLSLHHSRETKYQVLTAFPYCKQQNIGWGRGTRLSQLHRDQGKPYRMCDHGRPPQEGGVRRRSSIATRQWRYRLHSYKGIVAKGGEEMRKKV